MFVINDLAEFYSNLNKMNSNIQESIINDLAIRQLSVDMQHKLHKKMEDGRGGWYNLLTEKEISDMLHEHVEKGDPLDVAIFCMMLHYKKSNIMDK